MVPRDLELLPEPSVFTGSYVEGKCQGLGYGDDEARLVHEMVYIEDLEKLKNSFFGHRRAS